MGYRNLIFLLDIVLGDGYSRHSSLTACFARTEIPLTSILCRILQRRLVQLGSPQGERKGSRRR